MSSMYDYINELNIGGVVEECDLEKVEPMKEHWESIKAAKSSIDKRRYSGLNQCFPYISQIV